MCACVCSWGLSRECLFLDKAVRAEEAGAAAVVIYDYKMNEHSRWIDMIGDDKGTRVSIPTLYILGQDGFVHAADPAQQTSHSHRMTCRRVHIANAIRLSTHKHALVTVPVNISATIDSPDYPLWEMPPWTQW
jgi:hypothetical protein